MKGCTLLVHFFPYFFFHKFSFEDHYRSSESGKSFGPISHQNNNHVSKERWHERRMHVALVHSHFLPKPFFHFFFYKFPLTDHQSLEVFLDQSPTCSGALTTHRKHFPSICTKSCICWSKCVPLLSYF